MVGVVEAAAVAVAGMGSVLHAVWTAAGGGTEMATWQQRGQLISIRRRARRRVSRRRQQDGAPKPPQSAGDRGMGHGNTNALYLRSSERGATAGSAAPLGESGTGGHEALTFDHCALTFQRWTHPVATAQPSSAGEQPTARVYELTNIVPYVAKYASDPWSGAPLAVGELVPLHFHCNEAGAYADPVTFRAFGPHTRLIVVRPTGNVYAWDTIHELCIRARHYVDLVDQTTPFDRQRDLWTIQDEQGAVRADAVPAHVSHHRTLTAADRIKYGTGGNDASDAQVNHAAAGAGAARLMQQLRTREQTKDVSHAASPPAVSSPAKQDVAKGKQKSASSSTSAPVAAADTSKKLVTTGTAAASFTSSTMTPHTVNERVGLSEEEELFAAVRALSARGGKPPRAYVRLTTSSGRLDLELYVDKAPVTCWNFLQLCRTGYYADTSFHRVVRGFMAQGGDPTGTGRGGESYYGHAFGDELSAQGNPHRHTARGVLSMANRGANTNTSQFFITFASRTHLDGKHTVFGRLADQGASERTLAAIERTPTAASDNRPLTPIVIEAADVYVDPMEEQAQKLRAKRARQAVPAADQAARAAQRQKRDTDRTTWLGTNLDEDHSSARSQHHSNVGKYLSAAVPIPAAASSPSTVSASSPALPRTAFTGAGAKPRARSAQPLPQASGNKKRRTGGGFGDFSSW